MGKILLKIEGDHEGISLRSLLVGIGHELKILESLDMAISGITKGSVDWIVTDLRAGSIACEISPHSRLADKDYGADISQFFVDGMRTLEEEGLTPPYFSDDILIEARSMLNMIGKGGTTGFEISMSGSTPIHVTTKTAASIKQLLPTSYSSLGSIEGRIEMVSLHKKPKFVLYLSRTMRPVTCSFDSAALLKDVKDLLGFRVNVFGMISYNLKGEPTRVSVDNIRKLRDGNELPSIGNIMGIDRDYTGGVDSADYVRSTRVG